MRVLLVRAGALGDLLLLRRTIASLKQASHAVTLLAPVVPGSTLLGPGVTGVDRLLPWEGLEVAQLLGEGRPPEGALRDTLDRSDVVLAYSRSATLTDALRASARRVIALDPTPEPGQHASRWLARPLAALGVDVVESIPAERAFLEETADAERRLAGLQPGYLAIHPGSGSPPKNWPAARFADFLAAWRRSTGRRAWVLCLGPAEADGPPELRNLGPDVVAQGWPARSLGAALAPAGLFLGNDSGGTHLAAAWGAPTLALFGPTDPAVWSPCGPSTRVVRSPTGRMEDLSVQNVLDEASALTRGREAL